MSLGMLESWRCLVMISILSKFPHLQLHLGNLHTLDKLWGGSFPFAIYFIFLDFRHGEMAKMARKNSPFSPFCNGENREKNKWRMAMSPPSYGIFWDFRCRRQSGPHKMHVEGSKIEKCPSLFFTICKICMNFGA